MEKNEELEENEGGLVVGYNGVPQGLIELGLHFKNKVVTGVLVLK